MTDTLAGTLEALVDTHGLHAVVAELAGICGAKAEHVRSNWQDAVLAQVWERYARALDRTAARVRDIGPAY